jgi:transcriptional regulator with XRE-family HTH domain
MTFGSTLRQLRLRAGYSIESLADEAGVTPSTLIFWERGAVCPSLANARKLARALAVGLDDLTGDLPEDRRQRKEVPA